MFKRPTAIIDCLNESALISLYKSTIHAEKAQSIPNRLYGLLETNQDIDQFLKSIYRYIQIGICIKGYQDKTTKRFVREIAEVTEFYVDKDNNAISNTIYRKTIDGHVYRNKPSDHLIEYIEGQGIDVSSNVNAIVEQIEVSEKNNEELDKKSKEEVKQEEKPDILFE